jgi:hypothetical protein
MRCAHAATDAVTSADRDAGRRRVALRIVFMGLLFIASTASAVAENVVYKCRQAGGGVLYADYPCQGSVVVDIKPAAPNPVAIERLQRAQADFDRAYSERRAREDNFTLRREELVLRRREIDASQGAGSVDGYAPDSAYVPAYGFYGGNYDRPYGKGRESRFHPDRRPEHRSGRFERRVPAVIHRPTR